MNPDFKLLNSRLPETRAEIQQRPLSSEARRILVIYATELWGGREVTEQKGILSAAAAKFYDYLPNSTSYEVGSEVGRRLAVTHGPLVCNRAIEFVVRSCFKEPVRNPTFYEKIWGSTQKPLTEAAKLTFTPKAMEYLPQVGAIAGGIGTFMLVQGIASVYNKCMGLADINLANMSLEGLVKVDAEGYLTDVEGNRLTTDEFSEIQNLLAKHILLMELTAKGLVKSDAEKTLREYLVKREDGQTVYLNGEIVSPEELVEIEKGIDKLTVQHMISNHKMAKEQIIKLIELLASNLPTPDLSIKPVFWRDYLIKCADGTYCVRNEELARKNFSTIKELKIGTQLTEEQVNSAWEEEKTRLADEFEIFNAIDDIDPTEPPVGWSAGGLYINVAKNLTGLWNTYLSRSNKP